MGSSIQVKKLAPEVSVWPYASNIGADRAI